MALVKGICKNFGECDLADNKEVQEVDKTNFVCEECGKPLHPVDGGGGSTTVIDPWWKKKAIIIPAMVLGIAAIGVGSYLLTKTDKGGTPNIELTLNHTSKMLNVGENDTLIATVTPEGTQATIAWKASKDCTVEVQDGIVKAVKGGSGKVRVQAIVGKDTLSAICKYTVETIEDIVPPKDSVENIGEKTDTKETTKTDEKKTGNGGDTRGRYHGTLSLSAGTYSGDILNGKPDGAGVLTYKGHQKAGRNIKTGEDVYAESGERVDGIWNNGYLSSGTLFKKDGNAIKIKY